MLFLLTYRMAAPVLEKMSRGELVRDMTLEVAPTWDNRNIRVAYMELISSDLCNGVVATTTPPYFIKKDGLWIFILIVSLRR